MTKKTSNTMKAVAASQAPTPEQLEEQKTRALRQKMMSIAEGIYIALAQNPSYSERSAADLINRAVELASAWMGEFYGLVRKGEGGNEVAKEGETQG